MFADQPDMATELPVVVFTHCIICNGNNTLDTKTVRRKDGSNRIPKFIVKEMTPLRIEFVFFVQQGPVHLVHSSISIKNQEKQPLHSYVEYMGVFYPRKEEYRYVVKEGMVLHSSSFSRLTYALQLRLSDSVSHKVFFAEEIQISVKKSLTPFFEPNSSSASVTSAISVASSDQLPMSSELPTHPLPWSHVKKQMIPNDQAPEHVDLVEDPLLDPSQNRKATNVLRELGFWLYSSNVGQYLMRFGDDRTRLVDIKEAYTLTPIWILGKSYFFKVTEESGPDSVSTSESLSLQPGDPEQIVPDVSFVTGAVSTTPTSENNKSTLKRKAKQRFSITRSAAGNTQANASARPKALVLIRPPVSSKSGFSAAPQQTAKLQRYGMLGDAYCIRVVRRYPLRLTLESLNLIRNFLTSQNYTVNWHNEFNIEAEETDGRNTQLRNIVFVRIYYGADGANTTTLDVNIFANLRKSFMVAAILSAGVSLSLGQAGIEARTADALSFADRFLAFVDVSHCPGDMIFREGFNVDVSFSRPSIEMSMGAVNLSNQSPRSVPHRSNVLQDLREAKKIEGELSMWRGYPPIGWITVFVKLEDNILSYGRDNASIPLQLSAISFNCKDNPWRFDIHFNSCVYQLRAHDQSDFDRWKSALSSCAGLVDLPQDVIPSQSTTSINKLPAKNMLPPNSPRSAMTSEHLHHHPHVGGVDEPVLLSPPIPVSPSPAASATSYFASPEITSPKGEEEESFWTPPESDPADAEQQQDSAENSSSTNTLSVPSAELHEGGVSFFPDPFYAQNEATLVSFLQDFQSRFWFTYRKDFARIEPSYFTTDVGWGCMLRTAQMLMAQAISQVLLSRDWRLHLPQTRENLAAYKQILSWFNDRASPETIFSIHNMARIGTLMDKKIGEWFGPSTAAYVMRRLAFRYPSCPVVVYVNQEQTIYKDIVTNLAYGGTGSLASDKIVSSTFKPVVILLPMRLGVDKLNESYYDPLRTLFTIPYSIGIAGGKPCKSLYFVGCQDLELFYLDPHILHPFMDMRQESLFPVETFHCDAVRGVSLNKIDPSMLVGFVVSSAAELDALCVCLEQFSSMSSPLVSVIARAPNYVREIYNDEAATLTQDNGVDDWVDMSDDTPATAAAAAAAASSSSPAPASTISTDHLEEEDLDSSYFMVD